jgi:NAD-dependent dihydropyrimidine dehydrogenase PreA subunit
MKCIYCQKCVEECPENALEIHRYRWNKNRKIRQPEMLGTSCRRCVNVCPENAIDITKLKLQSKIKFVGFFLPFFFLFIIPLSLRITQFFFIIIHIHLALRKSNSTYKVCLSEAKQTSVLPKRNSGRAPSSETELGSSDYLIVSFLFNFNF